MPEAHRRGARLESFFRYTVSPADPTPLEIRFSDESGVTRLVYGDRLVEAYFNPDELQQPRAARLPSGAVVEICRDASGRFSVTLDGRQLPLEAEGTVVQPESTVEDDTTSNPVEDVNNLTPAGVVKWLLLLAVGMCARFAPEQCSKDASEPSELVVETLRRKVQLNFDKHGSVRLVHSAYPLSPAGRECLVREAVSTIEQSGCANRADVFDAERCLVASGIDIRDPAAWAIFCHAEIRAGAPRPPELDEEPSPGAAD